MKKKFLSVLLAGVIFCTASCAAKAELSFTDVYENGLGLTEDQFIKRYTELDESSAEITEQNGFTIWAFPEQDDRIAGYPAAVTAGFWDGKLDTFRYDLTFSDYESAYPALTAVAAAATAYFGETSPYPIGQESFALNKFTGYDDFLQAVTTGIEEENVYIESDLWKFNAEGDNHDYRADLSVQAFEDGTVYIGLKLYDWKGMSVYNAYTKE